MDNRLSQATAAIGSSTSSVAANMRSALQSKVDTVFEFASDYYVISQQDRTTELWSDIGVRLTRPHKLELERTLGDDFYQIIFKDGTYVANLGDIYEFNDYRYMVVDVGLIKSPTSSCIIQRCNIQLKFVASNVSVISATPPSYYTLDAIGVTSLSMPTQNRMIQLSDSEMMCMLPNSDTSKLIKYSSSGTRFLLGNPLECWTCIAIDSITDVRPTIGDFASDVNGIIKLKLSNKISGINKSLDNLTLGIAKQNCY